MGSPVSTAAAAAAASNVSSAKEGKSDDGGAADNVASLESKLLSLDERVRKLEKQKEEKELEIHDLRDRLEEEEFARRRVEEKLREKLEEERKKHEDEIGKINEAMEKQKREIEQLAARGGRPTARVEEEEEGPASYRGIILTDSNGRGATEDTVKNHIPREDRNKYKIEVKEAFTTGDALFLSRSEENRRKGSHSGGGLSYQRYQKDVVCNGGRSTGTDSTHRRTVAGAYRSGCCSYCCVRNQTDTISRRKRSQCSSE